MSIRSIAQLKSWFQKGLYPTQSAFWDLLDSFRHMEEKIPISDVDTLRDELNDKFNRAEAKQMEEMVENVSASFGEIHNRMECTEIGFGELDEEVHLLREELVAGDAATLEAAKAYTDLKPLVTDAEKAAWNKSQEDLSELAPRVTVLEKTIGNLNTQLEDRLNGN